MFGLSNIIYTIIEAKSAKKEGKGMYARKYKLNNSYTTYVIIDCEDDERPKSEYQKPQKPLEWKVGAKVSHSFHGKGVISSISEHRITVHFKDSKMFRKMGSFQISFEFKIKPNEIGSLHLC